jgi:hypothetical protein
LARFHRLHHRVAISGDVILSLLHGLLLSKATTTAAPFELRGHDAQLAAARPDAARATARCRPHSRVIGVCSIPGAQMWDLRKDSAHATGFQNI